jgi:putative ABC transport system ATP-binding protein
MAPIITATGLRFLNILRFPDIAVEREGATFICGTSGAGKSTLLKLINATLSPTEGVIRYGGADITGIDPITLRREVLLAGQDVFLFEDTIRGNFEQFFAYRDEPCVSEDEILQYLRLCSLEMPLTANCQTLSGGERQRVFLAIHLAMRPKVLMLDEPTSALDKKTARVLFTRLKAYADEAGITLVVISHDPALAHEFADHSIELSEEACAYA